MGNFDSIGAASARIADKTVSSVELCRELLSEIARQDPDIGAYSDILEETALQEAKASDRRRAMGYGRGPLDGIPLAVKDIIDTRPAICRAGLDHLADYRPVADAPVVGLLRNSGAIILGVTETDPGAFSTDTPQVKNPVEPKRSAGGSSGGSAAAVAAGLAFAALGTDTGGSVRIPAACCSVYGFKPSWGRVDTTGVRPLAPSLDHIGVLARSVADLQVLQATIDPALNLQNTVEPRTFSLGICDAYFAEADELVKQAMAEVSRVLRQTGVPLSQVSLPRPDEVIAFHMINLPVESAAYHVSAFPKEWPFYPDIPRLTIEKGRSISARAYHLAEARRGEARSMVDAALSEVDALILPTLPIDAPLRNLVEVELDGKKLSKLEATIRYTALFNQTGHPVISMPAAALPDGRATSIQLIGKQNSDAELLMLASRIQCLLPKVDHAALVAAGKAKRHNKGMAIAWEK